MNIDQFYSLLCCPTCKGDLTRRSSETQFYCQRCSFTFPIVEGIPVLLPGDVAGNMEHLVGRYWDSEERAKTYDTMVEGTNIFGVHNHVSELRGLMRYLDPSRLHPILDAGCGNGRFLAELPADMPSIGLDASLNLLRFARAKKRGHFHVCAELENLPFRDAQFGTVISCRVLQHLVRQREAIHELCRVVRKEGVVALELYNQWNPKTVYKNVRMSRWRKLFNLPFRLLFRSMSPFGDWGLTYDRYNNWFQTKRWLHESGMGGFQGQGLGFGYHKYLLEPLYVNAVLEANCPRFLQGYYDICLAVERLVGPLVPFRYIMEKFVIRAVKQ